MSSPIHRHDEIGERLVCDRRDNHRAGIPRKLDGYTIGANRLKTVKEIFIIEPQLNTLPFSGSFQVGFVFADVAIGRREFKKFFPWLDRQIDLIELVRKYIG